MRLKRNKVEENKVDERLHLRDRHGIACNADLHTTDTLLSTTDPDDITCGSCYGSTAFRTATMLKGLRELVKAWNP